MAQLVQWLGSVWDRIGKLVAFLLPILKLVHDVLIEWHEKWDDYFSGTQSQGRSLPRAWAVAHIGLAFFMIFGPCPRFESLSSISLISQVCVLALLVTSATLLDQHVKSSRQLLRRLTVFFVALAIIEFVLPITRWDHLNYDAPEFLEADRPFFPNLWHILGMIVLGIAWCARAVGRAMVESTARKFESLKLGGHSNQIALAASLANARATANADAPTPPLWGWLWETVFEALKYPLQILLFPALWIIVTDATWFDWLLPKWVIQIGNDGVAVFLFLCGVVVMGTSNRSNWPASRIIADSLQRTFFYNGAWATSVVVILLAALWQFDVSYVSTIMQGDRWVVIWYVLAAYSLSLAYNYWVNRWLSEQLVAWIFGGLPNNVSIYGSARFAVHYGPHQWRPIERTELIKQLASHAPAQAGANSSLHEELRVRMRAYYVILNTAVTLLFAGVFYVGTSFPRHAIVSATPLEQLPDHSNLAEDTFGKDALKFSTELLFKKPDLALPSSAQPATSNCGERKRPQVILLAASGGGTRAALFTASVLEGLHQEQQLKNVKLVSGVSGGGVALTYFAMHRDQLLNTVSLKDRQRQWDKFYEVMAHPYITEVLRGASEPRILWQSSIATLLAEGFDSEFDGNNIDSMKDIQIGLMLNSTLAGAAPPEFDSETFDPRRGKYASSLHAGGRLVFTNLRDQDLFPPFKDKAKPAQSMPNGPLALPDHEFLLFQAIQDPKVSLVRAAALNANFPPIFPNAAVDLVNKDGSTDKRFWVTDGGAEENKGAISLLYALRSAIRGYEAARKGDCLSPDSDELVELCELPDIHIVVADASGGSIEYQHDQGLGAAASAGGQLANQLAKELTATVNEEYKNLQAQRGAGNEKQLKPATITSHYIAMPSLLRLNGGIGTHWMMPERVSLRQFGLKSNRGITDLAYELSRDELIRLIRELHWTPSEIQKRADEDADRVRNKLPAHPGKLRTEKRDVILGWIANDVLGNSLKRWSKLVEVLKQNADAEKVKAENAPANSPPNPS